MGVNTGLKNRVAWAACPPVFSDTSVAQHWRTSGQCHALITKRGSYHTIATLVVGLIIAATATGCRRDAARQTSTLTLATTTSTRDSGLLDVLLPMFESASGVKVKVIAVGSGQALEMGRRGDADVLLTHAPEAEAKFLADRYADERRVVMYNDFVLLGPPNDPAGLRQADSLVAALEKLAAGGKAQFISRGDNSGTHMKEMTLWRDHKIEPKGDWRLEAGAGMAHTLRVASEKQVYTLADRGTFLAHREQLELAVVFEGAPSLRNTYSVLLLSAEKHPHLAHQAARRFADFLVSRPAQEAIARFGVVKHGQPLFFAKKSAASPER